MLVVDSSSEQWMAKWNALFKKFEISHLRSPMFFHTDPSDRDALLAFAHENGRMGELEEIAGCVGKEISKHKRKKKTARKSPGPNAVVEVDERDRKDYFTPSSGCFRAFCEECVQRYGLQEHIVRQETVADIDFDIFPHVDQNSKMFRISTDSSQHFARALVLAVGGGKPVIPAPFSVRLSKAASHAMWLEEDCVISQGLQRKICARQNTSALVIGGGLTSAQIADCLIRKGVSQVHLVMRGPWKVKPFDVDLSWMSKFRNQQRAAFWTADSFEERLQQAKEARNGGSITPRFSKKLKAHVQAGRAHVHTETTIASQRYCDKSCLWTIETQPSIAELPFFDHVYFATGTHLDARELGCLQTVHRKYPIETHGGLPALTDDLKWCDEVPLFVTGKLATLQIGPGAANLEGARLSAERIAWAIEEMLDDSSGAAKMYTASQSQKHGYFAGIGSRYDQLAEE